MQNPESFGELYDDRETGPAGHIPLGDRPVGTPLSMGGRSRAPQPEPRRFQAAPTARGANLPPAAPPTPSMPAEAAAPAEPPAEEHSAVNNLQRALQGFKLALPFVQKILPMLDGPVAGMVSNLLNPQPAAAPPQSAAHAPAQPRPLTTAPAPQHLTVDLTPVEEGLKRLQNGHRELHVQIAEHNNTIQRVADQLEMVREATDRNTLEQQELMEDLKGIGKRVNVATLIILAMLLGSVLLNLVLYLHMQRVLP